MLVPSELERRGQMDRLIGQPFARLGSGARGQERQAGVLQPEPGHVGYGQRPRPDPRREAPASILTEYQAHYNTARPHQGIAQHVPDDEGDGPRATPTDGNTQQIRRKPVLNGLINEYTHAA